MTPDERDRRERSPEALRRVRRREVRKAKARGGTVPYDLRTLIEDGHSVATIRAVIRPSDTR